MLLAHGATDFCRFVPAKYLGFLRVVDTDFFTQSWESRVV